MAYASDIDALKRELGAKAVEAARLRGDGPQPSSVEYARVQELRDAVQRGQPVESAALDDAQRWLQSADRYYEELVRESDLLRQQLDSLVGESDRVAAIRNGLRDAVNQLHGYDVFAHDATEEAGR